MRASPSWRRLADVTPGRCTIVLSYSDAVTQQHGFFHGGVIGTLADNTAAYAAFSLMEADSTVLTVEYKVNLVAPGRGDRLLARAEVIRPGRTLTVAQTQVFACEGEKETLCAPAIGTFIRLPGQPDERVTPTEKRA